MLPFCFLIQIEVFKTSLAIIDIRGCKSLLDRYFHLPHLGSFILRLIHKIFILRLNEFCVFLSVDKNKNREKFSDVQQLKYSTPPNFKMSGKISPTNGNELNLQNMLLFRFFVRKRLLFEIFCRGEGIIGSPHTLAPKTTEASHYSSLPLN